jgi:hypothetical protein
MGLILGIAQACGIPVEGVVDAAVAAATTVSPRGRVVHLDIELNGIVLTEIAGGRELVRRKVQLGDHTGWVRLRDAWAKCVARNFVSRTRFDPLHLAATEQVLYARLEELLPRLCRMPRATVELEAGGRVHTVEIEGTDLVDSVAPDYDGLLQLTGRLAGAGEPATLLLSDRMAGLPGLSDRLADVAGSDVVCLPAAAAASGALRHAEGARTQGDGVPYITRLTLMGSKPAPVIDGPKPPVALVRADARTLPTHVLHDGTAYPITDEPFALGSSNVQCRIRRSGGRVIVEPLGSHGSFLNGRRVEGATAVERGDRLRVGASGVEMQFIAVADDDATPRD